MAHMASDNIQTERLEEEIEEILQWCYGGYCRERTVPAIQFFILTVFEALQACHLCCPRQFLVLLP